MKRFDKDGDSLLRYSEFCEAFLPVDSFHASLLAKKAPVISPTSLYPFAQSTIDIYREVWALHLRNEMLIERMRFDNRGSILMQSAFEIVDSNKDGYIDKEDLREFFALKKIYVTDKDICALIERFDRSRDGRIAYHEFLTELTPN